MEEREDQQVISTEELFDVTLPEAMHEVRPGKWLRVRALSRAEMGRAEKLQDNHLRQEQYLLSVAVLEPRLSPEEVAKWQRSAAYMEVEMVARKINELSGVSRNAAKSGVHDDGDEPES